MDLPEPVNTCVSYSDSAPLLLVATSDRAMQLARPVLDNSGYRVAGQVHIAGAAERLRQQGALGCLWIEIDEDSGAELDSLLALAGEESSASRYSAVVSISAAMV